MYGLGEERERYVAGWTVLDGPTKFEFFLTDRERFSEELLEGENDRHLGNLANKVSKLKQVGL